MILFWLGSIWYSSSTDESLLVLSGLSSFSDALEWKPSKGTQFLVVDRETLSLVSRGETEPWYQWHLLTAMWMLVER